MLHSQRFIFVIRDESNSVDRLTISSGGQATVTAALAAQTDATVGASLDKRRSTVFTRVGRG